MEKVCYEKPDMRILELEVEGLIAQSEVHMGANDGNGGNAPGLSFDPITGMSIQIGPEIDMKE